MVPGSAVPMAANATSALLTLGQHDHVEQTIMHTVSAGLWSMKELAFQRDPSYTLFRAEDATAWLVFTLVFTALIIFDNCVLHRSNKALTVGKAVLYTLFWVACACAFCGYISYRNGTSAAFNWMSGYMLEWMLSFDNLFVFHLIFSVYATPDHLKHKPLFLGICGAVIFRLTFLFVGEYLMHAMFLAHFFFGAFLLYTGFKTAMVDDDEDEDPSKNPLVRWLCRHVPFVSAYDSKGAFFVKVPLDEEGRAVLPDGARSPGSAPSAPRGSEDVEAEPLGDDSEVSYGTVDFATPRPSDRFPSGRFQWRATLLVLVVICLEVSDILFAVDSVSAIVAQVPDLFLAYTSAVFAMLGLRATFFIIDVLVKLFSLLKYGVAAVLVFIGLKLVLSKLYHVPPGIVCVVLFTTISTSMVASVVQDQYMSRQAEKQAITVGMDEKSAKAK